MSSDCITKGRKRVRCEKRWKKNIRKSKKLAGRKYISSVGKPVESKKLKPPCQNCRNKCSMKISDDERKTVFNSFWNEKASWDCKRQFVASHVKSKEIIRKRPINKDNTGKEKNKTFIYSLFSNNQDVVVCKTFFLNTLSISNSFVKTCLQKSDNNNGIVTPDLRGRHMPFNKTSDLVIESIRSHIKRYPTYQSHYSRERTNKQYLGGHLNISKMYSLYLEECQTKCQTAAKEWQFRKIFNEEFNYSFHAPSNDTCDICDSFAIKLKDNEMHSTEKDKIKNDQETHLKEATARYNLKKIDKDMASKDPSHRVLMVDLQKCLPTPLLTNSSSFYLRKLWSLNYTIHEPNNTTWCMMWDEVRGGRGGNEMASCFFKWASNNLINSGTKEVTIWSDNCTGQNRNMIMVMLYFWLVHYIPDLEVINHKFLLRGHTHMEVDSEHSIIERAKKHITSLEIFTCNDWANFIKSCRPKNPFKVHVLMLEDFKSFSSLMDTSKSPLIARKRTTENSQFHISNVVWLQIRKNSFGKLYFKNSFSEDNFQIVDCNRNTRRSRIEIPKQLPQLRMQRKMLSTTKYNDLLKLLQWIPEEYKEYYKNLPHGDCEENVLDEI